METRGFSILAVVFVAVSIFLSSSFALARPGEPLDTLLGQENLGSLTDVISNSAAEAPAPNYDTRELVLAGNRTKRPDILNKFRKYRGGWDIANKHYWWSVGFTGAAAFVVAVLWLISFGVALVVHYFCGWKINIKGKESKLSLRICLLLLIIFTAAAAIGCILLSVGQDEFHGEAFDTLNYVVNQSQYIVQTLRNVTEYLSLAKNVSVAQIFLPSDIMEDIDKVNIELNTISNTVEQKTNENSGKIHRVFNAERAALITVAAVMLVISVLGLVLSILGYQNAIHIFIISGWILVSVTFVLCGIFVILNNAITDTCVAMREWVENPHAETALSNILPCVDPHTTNRTLFKSKQVINDIVNLANGFVGSVANSNPPPNSFTTYYNQSGPLIPPLCYPYDAQLLDRSCSAQELSMGNASLVWQNYTCTVSALGICSSVGRLTPDIYGELVIAVNISYALQHYAPPLLNLQNCDFVRDTFRNITSNNCPPLEHNLRIVNAGLALISVGVMLSLVLWIVFANRPQREEVFAKIRGRFSGQTNSRSRDDTVTSHENSPNMGA